MTCSLKKPSWQPWQAWLAASGYQANGTTFFIIQDIIPSRLLHNKDIVLLLILTFFERHVYFNVLGDMVVVNKGYLFI